MAKSINPDIIRKLIEYFLKKVSAKAMYTLTVTEVLLFERRSVLAPTLWVTGS